MKKFRDFWCFSCEEMFEALVRDEEMPECRNCGSESVEKRISAPRIGLYNNPEARSAALKKRSEEHTKREQKKGNMLSPRDFGMKG